MKQNRVCDVIGIEKPVIQGAMAWAATAPLVAAVSEAGGLGVLGVGFAPVEFIELQIAETKKRTCDIRNYDDAGTACRRDIILSGHCRRWNH